MISIFDYTDFRKYLTDFYDDRKKADPRFSYRSLTALGGINPGNFAKMLKGERNFSIAAAIRLARALKLNKRERDYFQAMVLFCQAKNHEEKKQYFEELMAYKESSVRVLNANHYLFYDKWYYTAVREALAFFPLTDDNIGELGKCITPSISAKQVTQAIGLLISLELVEKGDDGCYRRTNALLSTGNDIRSLTLNNFVINTMKLAEAAINRGMKETNLSTVTFSVSGEDFKAVQEEIRRCRGRIMEIAKESKAPDRVYQFNMQLFPLTERYDGGGHEAVFTAHRCRRDHAACGSMHSTDRGRRRFGSRGGGVRVCKRQRAGPRHAGETHSARLRPFNDGGDRRFDD